MTPKVTRKDSQNDLFRVRLEALCDPQHALIRLADTIAWKHLDNQLKEHFCTSNGAPALPTRLVAGLMYLQHTYNLSDEQVVDRWVENGYWQYFCGETFFSHQLPCDPSSLVRWRKRIGESGCERLLQLSIEAAVRLKQIKLQDLEKIVVDSTVQEKNITYPTDSKLYDTSRKQLIEIAHDHSITLRQTYDKLSAELMPKIARYGHARQYKRMRKAIKRIKGSLGRVYRDLERQIQAQSIDLRDKQNQSMNMCKRLLEQTRHSKKKLYSLHAPEVDCISKGKVHKRYEFGCKVSVATTHKGSWVAGMRSYAGNPYDGHTLADQRQQVETLTGKKITDLYTDRGYKGHGITDAKVWIAHQKGLSQPEKKRLKRRNSIEPIIGHMKSDGKLRRSYLKGVLGDANNAILCGCGQNLRKLLNYLREHPGVVFFVCNKMAFLAHTINNFCVHGDKQSSQVSLQAA